MSFIRAEAVTGFTFGLVNKTSGAALTGAAAGIGKYITKDGGTQASIAGSIAEEGNGQYSVDLTSSRPPSTSLPNHNTKCLVRRGVVSRQVHMRRAVYFQSGLKSDRLKACHTPTHSNEHMLADRQT